ncbi:MAG: sugar transporter permease, partial [Verrucomicrobia bacterium]|nr:sugar transporter permease [Verrucomicrobiota bacterium]
MRTTRNRDPSAAAKAMEDKSPSLRMTRVGREGAEPGAENGIGLHVVMTVLSLIMILPFAWMVLASFKTLAEAGEPAWLPAHFQWGNYPEVFRVIPFLRFSANSLVIAGWVTLLQVFTSALAAYSFSRLEWPGRDKIFFLY